MILTSHSIPTGAKGNALCSYLRGDALKRSRRLLADVPLNHRRLVDNLKEEWEEREKCVCREDQSHHAAESMST